MPAALCSTSISFHDDLKAAQQTDASGTPKDAFFEELDISVTECANQMRALADRVAARMEKKFQCEVLLKMPKDIRSMKMREFCVTYGGDVDEALKNLKRRKVDEMPPPMPPSAGEIPGDTNARVAPASASRPARGVARNTAETPGAGGRMTRGAVRGMISHTPQHGTSRSSAAVPFTPRVHETPRMARGGEMILSANGSPINVLDTVKAKIGKRGRHPEVVLTLIDGRE
ncbi:MAG: hypothetical protein SGPRY_010144, partial [Prymnesium sp.]